MCLAQGPQRSDAGEARTSSNTYLTFNMFNNLNIDGTKILEICYTLNRESYTSDHFISPEFNLGKFKGGHFHLISDEKKTVQYFLIHIMFKMAHSSFNKRPPFDSKGGQCPHGPL